MFMARLTPNERVKVVLCYWDLPEHEKGRPTFLGGVSAVTSWLPYNSTLGEARLNE